MSNKKLAGPNQWQTQKKKAFKGTKNHHQKQQPGGEEPSVQPIQEGYDATGVATCHQKDQPTVTITENQGVVNSPDGVQLPACTQIVCEMQNETTDNGVTKKQVQMLEDDNAYAAGNYAATGNACLDLQEDFNFANSLALIPTNAVLSVNSLPKAGAKGEVSTVASGSNQLPSGVCQRVLVKRAQVAGTEVKDTGSVQKDDTGEEMENAVTGYDAVPLLVVQPPPVTGATGQLVDALPHAVETTKNWVNRSFGKIGFATKWDEEHPKIECTHNREPLSIHDKLKQYAGYEHEPDVFFLGDMFNECLEGNALTPTQQLEFMCNEASKVIKVAGQSNWNLNAQPFTPNAIPPQGIVVATEKAEPNDVATESAPVQPKRVQPSRSFRSKPYRGKG